MLFRAFYVHGSRPKRWHPYLHGFGLHNSLETVYAMRYGKHAVKSIRVDYEDNLLPVIRPQTYVRWAVSLTWPRRFYNRMEL